MSLVVNEFDYSADLAAGLADFGPAVVLMISAVFGVALLVKLAPLGARKALKLVGLIK